MAQVYFVEIQTKDFLLAQLGFDLKCQDDFLDLTKIGFFRAQKEIAGDLHRNGTAALTLFSGSDQLNTCPNQAFVVYSGVTEKSVIFGCYEGFCQFFRDSVSRDRNAFLFAKLGN